MQNSPKLRFKEFNDEWQEWKFGDKGTFLKGNNLSKSDITTDGYPCLLYGELYTKYAEIAKEIYSHTNRKQDNQVVGHVNDVLLPSSGETAIDISTATCLQVDNVLLGGDLNIFRSKEIDGRFLSYELNHSKRRKIASIAQGATVVHLYSSYLKSVKLSSPCKQEQQKIADFLSKVDEVITEREAEVKDLEQRKRGLMQKIFSQQLRFTDSNNNPYPDWEEKMLKKVTSYVDYRGKTPKKVNQGIFLITAKNIKDGYIDYNCSQEFVEECCYNEVMSRGFPKIGDVLITTEAPCGNVAQINKINVALAQRIIKYRGNKDVLNNTYLKYYFLSRDFQSLLNKMATGGTVKGIKGSVLHTLKVKIPCLEEQEKIANVLSKLDELIEEKKALLFDWQQFKKGLLQQMFV